MYNVVERRARKTPPWVSLLGVHRFICLGRRSFLLISRAARGLASSSPRGCWSTHFPSPRHPFVRAQIAQQIFQRAAPCPLHKRSAASFSIPFRLLQNGLPLLISCTGSRFSCKIFHISIRYWWDLGSRDIFARSSWLLFPNTASFNSDRCGGA